jgi:hypothetical protein
VPENGDLGTYQYSVMDWDTGRRSCMHQREKKLVKPNPGIDICRLYWEEQPLIGLSVSPTALGGPNWVDPCLGSRRVAYAAYYSQFSTLHHNSSRFFHLYFFTIYQINCLPVHSFHLSSVFCAASLYPSINPSSPSYLVPA